MNSSYKVKVFMLLVSLVPPITMTYLSWFSVGSFCIFFYCSGLIIFH